jgi:hypothetical protein
MNGEYLINSFYLDKKLLDRMNPPSLKPQLPPSPKAMVDRMAWQAGSTGYYFTMSLSNGCLSCPRPHLQPGGLNGKKYNPLTGKPKRFSILKK